MSASSRARLVEAAWLREVHSGAAPAARPDAGVGDGERAAPVLIVRTNGRRREAPLLRG